MDAKLKELLHDAMDCLMSEDRELPVITDVTKRICEALGHQYPPYKGTGLTEDDECAEPECDGVNCADAHWKPCCDYSAAQEAAVRELVAQAVPK